MSLQTLILVAIGLSMDAFGASISRGAASGRMPIASALKSASLFGAFAIAAPIIGGTVGIAFYDVISALDHWVAFILLSVIGGKMIFDARTGNESPVNVMPTRLAILLAAAIATNIDAAVVGIALPGLHIALPFAAGIIGATTFVASFLGIKIGHRTSVAFGHRAEMAGGAILIAIGTKILIEHTLLAEPKALALQAGIFG